MRTGKPYITSALSGALSGASSGASSGNEKLSDGQSEDIQFSGWQLKMQKGGEREDGDGTAIVTREKVKLKKPNLYRVLLLNDDFTPMHFVIHVLQRFFAMNEEQATQITLHVHNKGVGECGVFTYEVAETKVTKVMNFARDSQHPLQCVMEKK